MLTPVIACKLYHKDRPRRSFGLFRRCFRTFALICLLLPWTGQSAEKAPFTCQTWGASRVIRAAPPGDDEWTLGQKKLLFCRARFTDTVETEPLSKEEADASLTEANRRFTYMSYGQFSIDWTITPLLQLEHDIAYYKNAGFAVVLSAVRNAALAAGYNTDDYQLDLIHTPQIPGFPAGQATIRGKGALIHQSQPSIMVHELGHCLGLFHANLWDYAHAPLTFHATPPFPSNIGEYGDTLLFDPASLMGDGDLRSPGRSIEYGDLFDPMGSSQGDFNPSFKARLHWLKPVHINTINVSGLYRVYSYDQGTVAPDRSYALRIPRLIDGRGQNFTFRYWLSYRTTPPPEGISAPTGLQLHWMDQNESYVSQLLDMLPATSPQVAWDSALPLGRTHSDWEIGVHITPKAAGLEGAASWMDVQIEFDPPPKNRAPSLAIQPQKIALQLEEPIELIATAEDPDGDNLSFFWNFGDGTYAGGSKRVLKNWKKPGEYLVRCEVSDGKGGKTSRQVTARVGLLNNIFFIRGRVLTAEGIPVEGAFITNGKIGEQTGMLPDFRMTQTDSDGSYILTQVIEGNYDVGAQAYGWVISRKDGGGPVTVDVQNIADLDFIATPVPKVTVSCPASLKEGESMPITFTRSGSTESNLVVLFALNGTAGSGQDYVPFSQRITIPAGSDSASVTFQALEDLDEDPDEQLLLTAIPSNEMIRSIPGREGPREITYFYPGWEPRFTAVGESWFQTPPAFQRGAGSTTSFKIVDTTPPGIQRISVLNQSGIAYERPRTTVPLRITRLGSTAAPLEIHYTIGGTAINGVDYDFVPSSVTIPSGSDFTEVNIAAIPDDDLEGDETVEFTILPSEAYRIEGNSYVLLTIQEDEFHSEPNSLHFGFRWGGSIVVQVHGEAGKTYLLETSADLIKWDPVSTNKLDFSPAGVPIDPFIQERRFYRSHQIIP
jgi:hypothetical protein